jgi:hypothetical protein
MPTNFYRRTAYRLSEQPVPNCFLKLDEHFDRALSVTQRRGATTHIAILLAESVCARMADVEMFAFLMEDARKRHRLERDGESKAAILTRSFMIGYLGAARALLDSGANVLATLYHFAGERAERSFVHPAFWQQFVACAPNVHRRYHPLRLFFNEVNRWCAETTDRIPPLEANQSIFGVYPSRDSHMKVLDEALVDLVHLPGESRPLAWIDPLQLHDRWKPQFLGLCEKLCQEIETNV